MPDTAATGSLNKVPLTTEERAPDLGLLFFPCLLFPPFPVHVCFDLSHPPLPLSPPSIPLCRRSFFAFPNIRLLFLPVLFKCYGGEGCTSPVAPPLFLIVPRARRRAPAVCRITATHAGKRLYGESAFLKR